MYCLVDFRNRPLLEYSFRSRQCAREYLRKIKNNPLGTTIIHADGRREYFENGLPAMLPAVGGMQAGLIDRKNISRIKRGFHIKYRLQKLNTVDGLQFSKNRKGISAPPNWRFHDIWPLFMLGNRKFYSCLMVLVLAFFSFSFFFQEKYGPNFDSDQNSPGNGLVLGASSDLLDSVQTQNIEGDESVLKLANEDLIFNLLSKIQEEKQEEFEKEILKYIKGRPMEAMAPYIAREDRKVAAFLVGIAMKESKFGVYAPHSGTGRDCFNYWGYRGRENTTASGYSCFNSPEHAVQVVGKKIATLVDRGISNPAEMISWKCGSSCAGHGAENVRKWIADVGIYFSKINS